MVGMRFSNVLPLGANRTVSFNRSMILCCYCYSFTLIDAHGHDIGSHAAHGPEGNMMDSAASGTGAVPDDVEAFPDSTSSTSQTMRSQQSDRDQPGKEAHHHQEPSHSHQILDSAISQVVGVAILEFGVVLHRWGVSGLSFMP
jgi:hypothetical protein